MESTYLSPSRPGRMAIDSLLNPPVEVEKPASKIHYDHHLPQYSPGYPPSPHQYYYSFSENHHPYRESTASSQDQAFMPYRPRSTESSPGGYSRDRYDSVSSSSSNAPERRRPPRPKYEEEEMYFIWYHRVDLCQEWKEVRESFNRQFPSRQRRGFQGIQCKFYRFIREKKCPTLRQQRRMRDGEFLRKGSGLAESNGPRFGVVEWMGVWYPWMRENKDEVMTRRIPR
ncbi:hypothetical protein P175DRAFT_0510060 [Aspergillus ochraceoroseus IBT 24754]|uniref:Uncharacterized protein n=3 Tax=Aspergillus subgen. Nidulantes TaxID=2720870 RepID=A0A0F8TZD0_9EURO|nr:uncharacterized protein P175DRAFT_0510060 [Aspergillus ochraceoroseus IBT 24754]KKK12673.1 hypothetical protein ARAM_006321 [Aspergillus rambellii]KKK21647.1 hypothetical protein AOCH_007822 [Aspergillus ochraceoroseus]PTU20118.1 hypothetical protein P175DRAFT_0510060 [Aspergillus ochraceoroseus IBT 24754]